MIGELIPPITHHEITKNVYRGIPVHHTTWMIKSGIIKSFQYNQNYNRAQDQELLLRLYKLHRFYNLQQPLVRYSLGSLNGMIIKFIKSRYNLYRAQIEQGLNALLSLIYFILSIVSFVRKILIRKI